MNLVKYLFKNKENSDDPLILSEKGNISYKEIWDSILKVCKIMEKSFQKRIILLSENSPFFIKSYFGIIASGNICIPLNPKLNKNELDKLILRINPEKIFVEKDFDYLNEITEKEILDSSKGDLKDVEDEDLASIMFTSGTTKEPKGVMISHKNIISNTDSILHYLQLTNGDIMEVVLPFHYCYGLSLLHTHTKVGGKIVLNNKFVFPKTVINDLKEYGCTGFAGVPIHFEILIKNTNFLNEKFPKLRYLTQAGGKMSNDTILKIFNTMDAKLFVMYGQTEATSRLSFLSPEKLPEKIGSIGKGILGVEMKIVNSFGKEIAPGETGEIIVKGDNVMGGYYNDKESTTKRIINGWLYTGDFGTKDSEGYIYLHGRRDRIVKVGGHRINLEEVENEIKNFEMVNNCYLTSQENKIFGSSIIAIVEPKERIKSDEIMKIARGKLTSYKLPQRFIVVDKIPVTDAGKVLKKEIQELIK